MMGASDLLADYRKKRDFARTREPAGNKTKSSGNLFVVQKHDARQVHFDFRIELDGVLKSWAVAKGPSNNPADKRLAVRVEDHPVEYGNFEGTIPKGEYGGGTVMLWDTGTWEPIGDPHEGLKNGDLKMRLHGERMSGEWVLVHMKGRDTNLKNGEKRENWLLIKHKDDTARDKNTLTTRFTRSVSTSRSFEEIAKGAEPKKQSATPKKAVWHSDPDKKRSNTPAPAKIATKAKPSRPVELPDWQQPQLATLVSDVPSGEDWQFEMKYDGYRCLAALNRGQVRLFTRNGKDWTETFAAIVPHFEKLAAKPALIDGELCALDGKGRTDFATLRKYLSEGGPLMFFAFDILMLGGEDLTGQPLSLRRKALEKWRGKATKEDAIQLSPYIDGNGEHVYKTLCQQGYEGVIAKRIDAPYRGARNRDWLKIKCTRRQEFVIGGWSPSSKRTMAFASLLVGTFEGKKFVYRGRVGTGFSQDLRFELKQQLSRDARKTSPFTNVPEEIARSAHWVSPKYVAEIEYTETTPDGYLRHPAFVGLRDDKKPSEVKMETPKSASVRGQNSLSQSKPKPLGLTAEDGAKAAEQLGIKLSSADKLMFDEHGVTKGELAAYYTMVAPRLLEYAANRPLSLVRCPDGQTRHCFYQKHDTGGFPGNLKSFEITEGSGEKENYYYLTDAASILAAVQMGVLEFHIWGSERDAIEKPSRIIFDIDPDEGLDFADVKSAAADIRAKLKKLGLESFPMVTGGKGVHVIAPLSRRAEWDHVKSFCKAFAHKLATDEPERFTDNMSKAKRKGRMFIDYLRNERGSTAIAPFSTRARPGAPIAMPISWAELKKLQAANSFSLADGVKRAKARDPWTGYGTLRQSITKAMIDKPG